VGVAPGGTGVIQRENFELLKGVSHAGRLATMGHLAASVAHEINQPIGAARNNDHATPRFLAREPPDLAEVR
jgi:C4-dicarboxylate-specific signal transduction histidine kinase